MMLSSAGFTLSPPAVFGALKYNTSQGLICQLFFKKPSFFPAAVAKSGKIR